MTSIPNRTNVREHVDFGNPLAWRITKHRWRCDPQRQPPMAMDECSRNRKVQI
jgi:hypothetical protein